MNTRIVSKQCCSLLDCSNYSSFTLCFHALL